MNHCFTGKLFQIFARHATHRVSGCFDIVTLGTCPRTGSMSYKHFILHNEYTHLYIWPLISFQL